jgi:hypothetical protein
MGHIGKSAMLMVAALCLAACVKLIWEVTYPGPGNYSFASFVDVDSQGNVVVVGNGDLDVDHSMPEDRFVFIAKYSADGQLLWERNYPGLSLNLFGANQYVFDPVSSDLLFAALAFMNDGSINSHIILVDRDGQETRRAASNGLVHSVNALIASREPNSPTTFYALETVDRAVSVVAYDDALNPLWSLPISATALSPLRGALAQDGQGHLYASDENQVYQIDTNLLQVSIIPDLMMTEVLSLTVGNGLLHILGTSAAGSEWLVMNDGLGVVRRSQISNANFIWGGLKLFDDQTACFALANYGQGSNFDSVVGVRGVDSSGDWTEQRSIGGSGQSDLKLDDGVCVLTESVLEQPDLTVVRSEFYRRDGTLRDRIESKQFAAIHTALSGNTFVQAGITGPYTSESGTIATIRKYQLR